MQTRTVTEARRPVGDARTIRHGRRRIVRTSALTVIAGLSVVTLSGCSMQWASMASLPGTKVAKSVTSAADAAVPRGGASSSATPTTASPSANPTASDSAPVVTGDLASGSATHVLPAGAAQLVVDFWTTDAPVSLGDPAGPASTQVQLSAHLEGSGASAETRVSRFRATAIDASGATVVLVDDQGSFSITAPYSYGTVAQVPTRGLGASTTVDLQWDLLVETYPTSGVWFRQTVVDHLVIGLPAAVTTSTASSSSTSASSTDTTGAQL